jgi:hypothetical protein
MRSGLCAACDQPEQTELVCDGERQRGSARLRSQASSLKSHYPNRLVPL